MPLENLVGVIVNKVKEFKSYLSPKEEEVPLGVEAGRVYDLPKPLYQDDDKCYIRGED